MGISRTEVNLLRLLDSAPRQQNQAKLLHYVTTSRELLEKLAAETTSEGISSIAKGKINEYSDRIEELAARLASQVLGDEKTVGATRKEESYLKAEQIRSPIAALDSSERAVVNSLAGTGRANARAVEVHSLTSKTTCFQWFLLFVMTCMFIMVVLLIRIT